MGQQGGEDKNSMSALWGVGLLFAVGVVFWMKFGEHIKLAFIFVRYWELWIIDKVTQFMPFFNISEIYSAALSYTKQLTPNSITVNDAKQLSILTGRGLTIPYFVILYYLFNKVLKATVTSKYKKRYDMHSLRDQERKQWPQANVVSKIDLLKMDLDAGPWAMAQTPTQFCKMNNLLKITVIPPSPTKLAEGPSFKAEVIEDKAEQVFSAQLGKMWKGHKHIADYKRAMLACFIARGCRDSKSAMDLIIHMNASLHSSDEPDFGDADEILEKHIGNRDVQEIISKHAYEGSIFIALFLFAREDGVFPTSDFLWIKPIDRRFWYILNSVGRQTPSVEAAGVYAHFLSEKALNRKMTVPMVKEAVKALKVGVEEIIYEPAREERDKLLKEQFGGS